MVRVGVPESTGGRCAARVLVSRYDSYNPKIRCLVDRSVSPFDKVVRSHLRQVSAVFLSTL